MKRIVFLAAAALAAPQASAAPDETVYRQAGEWEVKVELVDVIAPRMKEADRQALLARGRASAPTSRKCMAAMTTATYLKVGDPLNVGRSASCRYTQVEAPGEPINRRAVCTDSAGESEMLFTGNMTPTVYELRIEARSISHSGIASVVSERGRRLGDCPARTP